MGLGDAELRKMQGFVSSKTKHRSLFLSFLKREE